MSPIFPFVDFSPAHEPCSIFIFSHVLDIQLEWKAFTSFRPHKKFLCRVERHRWLKDLSLWWINWHPNWKLLICGKTIFGFSSQRKLSIAFSIPRRPHNRKIVFTFSVSCWKIKQWNSFRTNNEESVDAIKYCVFLKQHFTACRCWEHEGNVTWHDYKGSWDPLMLLHLRHTTPVFTFSFFHVSFIPHICGTKTSLPVGISPTKLKSGWCKSCRVGFFFFCSLEHLN